MPIFTGTNGDDTLNGGGGNDDIDGGNGNDTLNGGGGNDDIDGGNGNDDIDGGSGDDDIEGGNGDDDIEGGSGDDEIDGENGNDTIDGGDDDDIIYGGNGNDDLYGGAGNDTLIGENGNDHLTGGSGNDILDGNNGFDIAYFSGPIGEYSFFSAGGYLHVVHLGGAGADGHDQLKRVERLVFADRVIDIGGGDNVPVAVDDHVFINEDTGVYNSGAASVLNNDFDFDGDALSVTPGVFVGTYGTLMLNANGTYSYTLNANAQTLAQGQNVQDSFNYTVSDNDGSDTGALVFHIAGLNDAPVAVADTNAGDPVVESGVNPGNTPFPGDSTATGNVLANDTDVDSGDTKTVSAVNGSAVNVGAAVAGTYGSVTIASNGSYTYTLNNADPDTNTLAQGASVNDVFSYTVQDANGATSTTTLTITITGTNDGPVAAADTNAGDPVVESGVNPGNTPFPGDTSAAGNVLANDTDVDSGDTKTVSAVNGSAVNVGAAVAGTYGSVTIASNGGYTYTLNNSDPDTNALAQGASVNDVFSYTVQDANGATSTTTLTITITGTNDGPVANADVDTTSENATVLVDVLANDTDVDNGAVLTVTAASAPVGQGSASVVGNQVEFDPGADFDYLAVGESVDVVVSYDIADEHGATDSATITITVTGTNDAPTIDAGGTDADGAVTELPNNDPNEGTFVHTDSGTIAFDDLDLSDTHSASFTPQGGGYLGSFTLDPVNQAGDTVGWDFSVSDADLDFLDEGETLVQTYTVEIDDGNGGTVTQDVTITLTGAGDGPQTEWYIDNSAVGSANLGTEADPYTSIAAFNAAQGTMGGPQVGATVYLLAGTGSGVYAEADGINLIDDQILVGVPTGPVRPTIEAAAGDGVNVALNNNISGLDIGNTSGADIADSGGSVGTLTIADVGTSGTGQIVDIDQGGTLNVTLNSAASTASSGGAVDLAGVGGSFTVTGATTITGVHIGGGIAITGSSVAASFAGGGSVATGADAAVNFVGNSGTLELAGGFDILTSSGAGFNASGGGVVAVTGAGNSIETTSGTALNVSNTDIGLAGLTFESISSNGAVNGIVLNNTGADGSLTVTGDAGSAVNGSGGTIGSSTGVGILLINTREISLDQLNVQSGLDDGIRGSNVTNVSVTNATIADNGNATTEHGAEFSNLQGSGTFTNVTFSNNESSQLSIINNSGTANVALTNVNVTSNGLAAAPNGLHGVHFETQGSASADLMVLGSAFSNLFSNSVHAINAGTGTLEVTVANSTFDHVGASAINIVQSNSGATRFYIHDNPTFLRGTNNGVSASININQTAGAPAGALLEGAISNNVIGNNSSTTSATTGGDGIRVFSVGAGTTTVRIDGNDIQGVGANGINVQMSGSANPAHTMNVTMFDNTVLANDINSFDGIRVVAGTAAGNAGTLRLDMHDNIASGTVNDFEVRQRFATTIELLNYVGGNTDLAAVQNYLDVTRANDPAGPGADWFITTQAPGGGFQSTAAVPQPTLPSPLLAAAVADSSVALGDDSILSQAEAEQLAEAAIQRWAEAGASAEQLAAMGAVSIVVSDMAGLYLGSSHDGYIRLDSNGAGHGWFVDSTPGEDSEFGAGGAAEGRIDALTVIMHELGHQIGLADQYHAASEGDLMHGFIETGERRLPDGVFETDAAAAGVVVGTPGWQEVLDMLPRYADTPLL